MASKKTFETSLLKLEEIVEQIENEETSLEDSLKLYKQAIDCIEFCSSSLQKAKLEVEVLGEKLKREETEDE